jgi:hypothetical protein
MSVRLGWYPAAAAEDIMPLYDWNEAADWETVHGTWIVELHRWLKSRLPAGFRSTLATVPSLVVAPVPVHSDVSVRRHPEPEDAPSTPPGDLLTLEPDERVSLALGEAERAVHVHHGGNLVAVLELLSPANKDRPDKPRRTTDRYVGYLLNGIHLLLVDVHPRPPGFSFADDLATVLEYITLPLPSPFAVSYRVGSRDGELGQDLEVWRRPLTVGQPLPSLPLPLTRELAVRVDLESTYVRAAADAYL